MSLCLLTACSNDDEPKEEYIGSVTDETMNLEFAKGLAKAMKDPEIRDFIKVESLKEVDKDFDVIYSLVKNRKMESGYTFRERLAEYMGGLEKLDSIAEKDPTLTILVPYLKDVFDAKSWDTESQIPIVAYRDYPITKNQKKLIAFDIEGESQFIERYKCPEKPTIVVKSNERLANPQDNLTKSTNVRNQLLNDEGELVAYFIDEEFSNISKSSRKLGRIVDNVTTILENDIYIKSKIETPESPRDYIYYGISTTSDVTKGELNTNYKEFITAIKFNSKETWSHVSDSNDPSGDWSDGNLEMVLDFLFLTKEEVLSTLNKMISIKVSDLFTFSYTGTSTYYFDDPIEVFNWDMYKYGDTFKIIVSEQDPGTAVEKTENMSTTFGNNWEIGTSGGFGKIWKINAKYSGSHTEVKQKSTKINTTNNSDPLGEVFVDFFNLIITNKTFTLTAKREVKNAPNLEPIVKTFNYGNNQMAEVKAWMNEVTSQSLVHSKTINLTFDGDFFNIYQSNTGMVSLSIIPIKIN